MQHLGSEFKDGDVTYRPFTDGDKAGFQVTYAGTVRYLYLAVVPRFGDMTIDPSVVVYCGSTGDVVQDDAWHHYIIDEDSQ